MLGCIGVWSMEMVIVSRWSVEVCDNICWTEEDEDSFASEKTVRKSEFARESYS